MYEWNLLLFSRGFINRAQFESSKACKAIYYIALGTIYTKASNFNRNTLSWFIVVRLLDKRWVLEFIVRMLFICWVRSSHYPTHFIINAWNVNFTYETGIKFGICTTSLSPSHFLFIHVYIRTKSFYIVCHVKLLLPVSVTIPCPISIHNTYSSSLFISCSHFIFLLSFFRSLFTANERMWHANHAE